MYRLFANKRKADDIYDILTCGTSDYKNLSWLCFISSSFPISGFFEFELFADFFTFLCHLYVRYPDTILTIYYKPSIL